MGAPSCVSPHRYPGHRLPGEPARVAALRVLGERGAAKRDGDGGDEAPFETGSEAVSRWGGQVVSPPVALPDSMAARCSTVRSSKSSLATLVSGKRSGWPVPNKKRSTPMVRSSVSR